MASNDEQLKKAGLKVTSPRMKILEILKKPENQHISAEDVYKILLEQKDEIGLATVYRVLNQFDDAGIITRHHFEGGHSVFELDSVDHHDHIVCNKCGKVEEFFDEVIENQQEKIKTIEHLAPEIDGYRVAEKDESFALETLKAPTKSHGSDSILW